MKSKKGLTLTITLGTLALFLNGCVQTTKAGKPYGFVYEYLAKPGQNVMEWLSQLFGNNYGWAIIGLTVIVRLVLLPMMINQQRKSTYQQEKMSAVRPQMEKNPGTAKSSDDSGRKSRNQ